MKKIVLVIALLLCTFSAFPQYIGFTPTYTPTSTSDWALIYAIAREASANRARKSEAINNALSVISKMKQYIAEILGQNIDETLRNQLNWDYSTLDEIAKHLRQGEYTNDIRESLLWVSDDINDNIVAYNNRVAEIRKQYEEEQRKAAEEAARLASEPQEWTGTGFALNKGYVVTNYHVVEDAKSISISGVNGNFSIDYSAEIVATDKVNDLAIVKINDRSFNGFGPLPYAITMQQAEVGDDIFVLGYPLTQTMGDEIKLTNGIISSRTGFQGDVSLYQMSAPIQPGNSGGPMFNSKGNVVGIVCAHHKGTENVGYAIKTSYLKNLAESSSLTNIFPTNNTVSTLPLSGKVKRLKKFVYLIKCSSETTLKADPNLTSQKTSNKIIITNVSHSKLETKIEFELNCTNTSICIDTNTYILADNIKYKIISVWGIDFCSAGKYYACNTSFIMNFPPIPFSATQIDLIVPNNSNMNIYGIKLQ